MSNQFKGYLLAFISVISVSNVYIFSKAALNEVSLAQFGIYWSGFGLLWILLYALKTKSFDIIKSFGLKKYKIFIILDLLRL